MSSVGQVLKEAREARGLTLYDLQEATKIQPRYLKAIEEDRLDVLPGHFYTRAFIRTYAEHVGVDPQPLLSRIEDPEDDQLESVQEFQKIGRRADREREPSFSLANWLNRGLLILFIALVVFVIYTAFQGANLGSDLFSGKNQDNTVGIDSEDKETDEEKPQEQKVEKENKENKENIAPVVTVKKTDEEGQTIRYEVSGVEEISMKVKADARVWFEAREGDSNGEVLASKVIEEGDTEQFTSHSGLYIRIGNTRGVDLTVNDTKVSTDYDQPRNFVFELKSNDSTD